MTNKTISEKAKIELINAIKSDLANDKDAQHEAAAYGRVGVYRMTQEQLMTEFNYYGIDPFSD